MNFIEQTISIFNKAINDYHVLDNVDQQLNNPEDSPIRKTLYHKCWIDTVQWHLEDIIRDPNILPENALIIKRRIDASNQERTDLVERIDDYFLSELEPKQVKGNARLNTESPAWAIDRLSILCLKIYHMTEESQRIDVDDTHRRRCQAKLDVLLEQFSDLSESISQLLDEIKTGDVVMKLYRQMKMYNDPSLNPVLYKNPK